MADLKLFDLEIYKLSMELSEIIYGEVIQWNYFDKGTLGKQIVRSSDSVVLNISEGYGRFHYKENSHYCYYARGSLYETIVALKLAVNRKLISANRYQELKSKATTLSVKLNNYIKTIGQQPAQKINQDSMDSTSS
jgi:four helix bundle protein